MTQAHFSSIQNKSGKRRRLNRWVLQSTGQLSSLPAAPWWLQDKTKEAAAAKEKASSLSKYTAAFPHGELCLVGKRTQSQVSTAQASPCWTEFSQTQPGDHRSLLSHLNKWLRRHCNMRVKESERVLILFLSGNITEVYASGIGAGSGGLTEVTLH